MRFLLPITFVLAAGVVAAAEPRDGDIARVEEQLVEQKLHLAQVYRFRGECEAALRLVRQVQAIRPEDRTAARMAVELWQKEWDEQIVRHIEKSPGKIALRRLDEVVDVEAVSSALIADIAERADVRHWRETTLIAPYVRPKHAAVLAERMEAGDRAERLVAASLLCVLGDARGDAYVRELLGAGLRPLTDVSPLALFAYASPETWATRLQDPGAFFVRTLALNIAYAGGDDARKQIVELAAALDMATLDAAIEALIELGEPDEAAKAVVKYRVNYFRDASRGGVGHKLLVFYAGLGDEQEFFELIATDEAAFQTPLARMLTAQMHMAAGRREEAAAVIGPVVEEIEKQIAQEPEDAHLYFRLAKTIAVAGTDPARAKALVLEALRHHPTVSLRPQLYGLLARLYLREGRLEQAGLLADAVVALYSSEHPRYVGIKRKVDAARPPAPTTH